MVIYKITNLINNKIYIGKTINDSPDYYGSGVIIKHSINKYGIENFEKEIIDNAESVEELNEKEIYWISFFDSTNLEIGYNIGKGGDGGDLITNNPNKEHFLEYCRNRTGEKNGMFGKNHTKESIELMSENRKGIGKNKPTWNKGLTKNDLTKEQHEKMYLNRDPLSRGYMFHFISPIGKVYKIKGGFEKFCNENKLDCYTARHFINRGKIKYPQKGKPKQYRINLVGWEIKKVRNES